MPNQEEIYQKVSATLVEALNVDEDEISPKSTLQGDLGAESPLAVRGPQRHRDTQFGIHGGQHLGVGDQIGVKHDRLKRPIIDVPGLEQLTHLR